jgi:hypothetical protein
VLRRSLRAMLMAALVAVPLAVAAPHASADCTDLGGNGTVCTTGDPTTGSFGVGVNIPGAVYICVVIQAVCP